MIRSIVFFALTIVFAVLPLQAQFGCPTLPAESPIAAPNPDNIPPASGAYLLDYNSNYFEGRANHVMGFVQTGPDEQKVWFTINSDPHFTRVFYNRRYRTSPTGPWMWAFSKSVRVLDLPSPGSAVVDAVLYSPTPKYGLGSPSTLYKYMMFITYQPKACDGAIAGFAMVSFSNDGICWTMTVPLNHAGGPSVPCASSLGPDLVQVETFDVIDGGNYLYFVGIEGDVASLVNPANMNRTFTSWGYTTPGASRYLTIPANPELSAAGVVSPEGIQTLNDRFKTYSYFINVAMAWDAASGYLFLTRAYPYPFDRQPDGSASTPSDDQIYPTVRYPNPFLGVDSNGNAVEQLVEGCPGPPATFPNRVQIYKMYLGSLSNFHLVTTGTWTLVSDIGNNVGYSYDVYWNNIPIQSPQTSVGRDYGAASFLRTGTGALQLVNGTAYMFAAQQFLSPLSVGPCRQTGAERSYLTVVPR